MIGTCRLGRVMRLVVDLRRQGLRFDPRLANYVYPTMLANNRGSWCEGKHKRPKRKMIY